MTTLKFVSDIFLWTSLLMLILGICGNIFLFIVYSKLKKISVALYFRVSSLINLFITLNWLKIFIRDEYQFNLSNKSEIICKLEQFSIFTAGPISYWIDLAVAFDRFITIVYPARSKILTRFRFQLSIIFLIVGANIAYYLLILFDENLRKYVSIN